MSSFWTVSFGQKVGNSKPTSRITVKIQCDDACAKPERGERSVTADLGIRCGIAECLGQVQAFESVSPGKGVVGVQEPQLSLLGKRCLYNSTFLSHQTLFPLVLHLLQEIASPHFPSATRSI